MLRKFELRYELDISSLNSLTKYPSIPTYHELDPSNGQLLPTTAIPAGEPLFATEKVDGTNARVIFLPDGDFLIGSREELLYASGDFIRNPALGIVGQLADRIDPSRFYSESGSIEVAYLEVYGGKVTKNSNQYTDTQAMSSRIFDVVEITESVWRSLLTEDPKLISAWRDIDTSRFQGAETINVFAKALNCERVPVLGEVTLPAGPEETYGFLKATIQSSHAIIDGEPSAVPEGIVVRNGDRSKIAKLRFADYERTFRLRSKGGSR